MARYDLHETLSAFLEALDVPPESGLVVDEAELNIPLEISVVEENGALRVYAQPSSSIYHSGFESLVHKTSLIAGTIVKD